MRRAIPFLSAVFAFPACGPGHPARAAGTLGSVAVAEGYLTVAPGGDGGTVSFTARNAGQDPDTLRAIEVAGVRATLHTVAPTGGMARMAPLPAAPIPAGGALELKTGGAHAMFDGLTRSLSPGDTVGVRISFARAGTLALSFPVEPYGGW